MEAWGDWMMDLGHMLVRGKAELELYVCLATSV